MYTLPHEPVVIRPVHGSVHDGARGDGGGGGGGGNKGGGKDGGDIVGGEGGGEDGGSEGGGGERGDATHIEQNLQMPSFHVVHKSGCMPMLFEHLVSDVHGSGEGEPVRFVPGPSEGVALVMFVAVPLLFEIACMTGKAEVIGITMSDRPDTTSATPAGASLCGMAKDKRWPSQRRERDEHQPPCRDLARSVKPHKEGAP